MRFLLLFISFKLLGMQSDEQITTENYQRFLENRAPVSEIMEEFTVIHITPEEDDRFKLALQRVRHPYYSVPIRVQPETSSSTSSLRRRISENKLLIVSNLITATLGAVVTLALRFTNCS